MSLFAGNILQVIWGKESDKASGQKFMIKWFRKKVLCTEPATFLKCCDCFKLK